MRGGTGKGVPLNKRKLPLLETNSNQLNGYFRPAFRRNHSNVSKRLTQITSVVGVYSLLKPMHMQPIYRMNSFVTVEGNGIGRTNAYINSSGVDGGTDIFRRELCLSSDNKMTVKQQDWTIEIMNRCFL